MALQYIGARYVPRFLGTYDNTQAYEALDVVDNGMGTSYITKIPTPAGTPLTNTTYWALYGASSGAIVNLQNQIDDITKLYVTPEMYGAAGDGITDDTAAINAMLADCENKIVLFMNTYLVDGAVNDKYENCGLRVRSNTHIIFAGGAKIIEKPNNTKESHIFNIIGVENVIIEGGEIVGDYLTHTVDSGLTDEWCHGIRILSSTNVTIKDMKISECFGDGIYIGQCETDDVITVPVENHCHEVTIQNVTIDHAGRNGISLCDCQGWCIDNVKAYRITRTAPKSGIDIETEGNFSPVVSDGCLSNYHTANCSQGINITNITNDIIIEGCTLNPAIIANNTGLVYWSNNKGAISIDDSEVVISNSVITNFTSAGTKRTKIINSDLTVYQAAGIGFKTDGEVIDTIIRGIYNFDHDMIFRGCRFIHDNSTAYIVRVAGASAVFENCVFELKGLTAMWAINDSTTSKLIVTNCHCDGDSTAITRPMISASRAPLANGNNYAPFTDMSTITPVANCVNFNY